MARSPRRHLGAAGRPDSVPKCHAGESGTQHVGRKGCPGAGKHRFFLVRSLHPRTSTPAEEGQDGPPRRRQGGSWPSKVQALLQGHPKSQTELKAGSSGLPCDPPRSDTSSTTRWVRGTKPDPAGILLLPVTGGFARVPAALAWPLRHTGGHTLLDTHLHAPHTHTHTHHGCGDTPTRIPAVRPRATRSGVRGEHPAGAARRAQAEAGPRCAQGVVGTGSGARSPRPDFHMPLAAVWARDPCL